MSHLHERKEKICLNCDAVLTGRYCHNCGQENVEPKESVWHLFVHFFNDVTHFDGKFFSTIRYLLAKPGFLSTAYTQGRRAGYLNPIRMYLFISFVFFFLKFTFVQPGTDMVKVVREPSGKTQVIRLDTTATDEAAVRPIDGIVDQHSVHEYDSLQKALPQGEKDNFIERYISRRIIAVQNYTAKHPDSWRDDMSEAFLHSIPKMLFVSIPIFAFILWLLYIRSRKKYYFVAHGIFTIHLYCAIFLLLIITFPLDFIPNRTAHLFHYVLLLAVPALYLYLAMRRFYGQGRFKTFLKFVLILVSSGFIFSVLALGFLLNALLAIASGGH